MYTYYTICIYIASGGDQPGLSIITARGSYLLGTRNEGPTSASHKRQKFLTGSWREAIPYYTIILIEIQGK